VDYYQALLSQASSVKAEPSETSYFSTPEPGLDPRLFRNKKLISSVRDAILSILFTHLNKNYQDAESWSNVWLAGSGVSFSWAAAREPADLDCLIGIDYVIFRSSNQNYVRFSDKEIASMLNEGFRNELHPFTNKFLDSFELTFYVNVIADIKKIKPYAAYSLTADDWTVDPVIETVNPDKVWINKAQRDKSMALEILTRYEQALTQASGAKSDAARLNAEATLRLAVDQGSALFEDIHKGRNYAFSPEGLGYADYANYRWQVGKSSGIVQALKALKDISSKTRREFEAQTYGAELPDASLLIRRAVTRK
jgi:hypothetical protein